MLRILRDALRAGIISMARNAIIGGTRARTDCLRSVERTPVNLKALIALTMRGFSVGRAEINPLLAVCADERRSVVSRSRSVAVRSAASSCRGDSGSCESPKSSSEFRNCSLFLPNFSIERSFWKRCQNLQRPDHEWTSAAKESKRLPVDRSTPSRIHHKGLWHLLFDGWDSKEGNHDCEDSTGGHCASAKRCVRLFDCWRDGCGIVDECSVAPGDGAGGEDG